MEIVYLGMESSNGALSFDERKGSITMSKSNTKLAAVAVAAVAVAVAYPTDAEMVAAGFDNLSKRIRHLSSLGAKTGEIAKIVKRSNGENPRYQHVRSVLLTPLKRTAEVVAPQAVEPEAE